MANNQLRIIHVADYMMPLLGYQELLLPKWNARHGHDVHLITSDRYKPIPNYDEKWGDLLGPRITGTGTNCNESVCIYRLPTRFEFKGRPWINGIIEKIRSLNPDILYCHSASSISTVRVARLASLEEIPIIVDSHMTYTAQNDSLMGEVLYKFLRHVTRRWLEPRVDVFLGVTEETCEWLENQQGISKEKIEHLPLGIDTENFCPRYDDAESRRKQLEIPPDGTVVLQSGKLSEEKSPELLAQAMGHIMEENEDIWLVYVGQGSEDQIKKIRSPLRDYGVEDRLLIHPFVRYTDIPDFFNLADIVVFPGASSMSALEAAACETAVIMTDLPAGRERANDGVGICYDTGDVSDLRQTILKLLDEPSYRRELGEQGRKAVVEKYSYDMIANRSEKIMASLVES